MAIPLVRTKLFVPRARPGLVARPRLVDRLAAGPGPRMTLVSAPAGFGKSTVLVRWVDVAAAAGRAVAWVSLDDTEQQAEAFWTYVAHAVEGARPGAGGGALQLLEGAHPSTRAVLTTLLNDLTAWPDGLDLVLDDYHLADGPGIADDVAFLVEHLPPQVRVVIGTRADPGLPLARLRARGELAEVRVADLRFTDEEAAAYLGAAGVDLDPADVATLGERTEGWVAAIQLAALSLRGSTDPSEFIAGFAGDDRYVVDYLVEEVLARQPDDVRRFLLETSVLDRMTGSLCDAVTQGQDGSAVLDLLDRSNLFVVALDDRRQWYRYHHLFADVLRAHLLEERRPEGVSALHQLAARWYAEQDEPVAAVRHAVAAGDVTLAADLVERSVIALLRERREGQARRWIDDIPDEEVRRRPVLAVAFIGALMSSGEFDAVPARLDHVEAVLAELPRDVIVLEESELGRLPGAVQTYRAALALIGGDPAAAIAHADLAIDRAAPGDNLTLAAAGALAGLAQWAGGDLDAAHRSYSVAIEGLRRAGNHADVLGCSITLADIRITQGRLGDAQRTYEDALRLAAQHDTAGPLRGTADMVLGLGLVALERGQLDEAAEHLARVDSLGESNGLPQHPYRWRVARARMSAVVGDLDGAVALLEAAERVYDGDFSPNVRPVPAQRARVLVAQGRLDDALAWAHEQRVSPDDDLSYVREYEHVTLARILLHQRAVREPGVAPREAAALLGRLRTAAEVGGRTGTLIEVLILQARAHYAGHGRHDVPGALAPLEEALRLAEPEGFVQTFVGEGAAMETLLAAECRTNPSWDYPRHLLESFRRPRGSSRTTDQGLVDPLSVRELDVLRLLATDLDGPGVARELVVSLNTVRTHTRNIYAKLGVNNRREAVSRARELGIVVRR